MIATAVEVRVAPSSSVRVPRAVIVTRKTEYQRLIAHHGTREQARFFLETRGQSLADVESQHGAFESAFAAIARAIPLKWRRNRIDRDDLDRFIFEPDDVVIALGQDGLVANTAKYLDGQLVLGFNPSPDRYDGILVPHAPRDAARLLSRAALREGAIEERTMVEVTLDDGQRLLALNELYLGHRAHQSSRYRLRHQDREERQSSSGVIVSTGTGSTGWARSIHRERNTGLPLPAPADRSLIFFVREAFPSKSTGVEMTAGNIAEKSQLSLISEMNDGGVIFGDGIEDDRLELGFGRRAQIQVARERLALFKG